MLRAFIVEGESFVIMADGVDAACHVSEACGVGLAARHLPFPVIDRMRRILREGMQDVGEDQLLMLLLVVQAHFHNRE